MAFKIISDLAIANNVLCTNNVKNLRFVYRPTVPTNVKLGEDCPISDIIPISETVTVSFKTKRHGIVQVATDFPLQVLACLYGANYHNADLTTDSVELEGETYPSQNVDGIQFLMPIAAKFSRFLQDGENFTVSVSCSSGKVDVYIIDMPFGSPDTRILTYRQGSQLKGTETVLPKVRCIAIPKDSEQFKNLTLVGNQAVVYDVVDLLSFPNDSFLTKLTPYIASDYFFLDLTEYQQVKLLASTVSDCIYYFMPTE